MFLNGENIFIETSGPKPHTAPKTYTNILFFFFFSFFHCAAEPCDELTHGGFTLLGS